MYRNLPGKAPPVKYSNYAMQLLYFTGGACPGDYGKIFFDINANHDFRFLNTSTKSTQYTCTNIFYELIPKLLPSLLIVLKPVSSLSNNFLFSKTINTKAGNG